MSIIQKIHLEFLEKNLSLYINSGFLKKRLIDFVKYNELTDTNYQDKLYDNDSKLLTELEKKVIIWFKEKIINGIVLDITILTEENYAVIEKSVIDAINEEGNDVHVISDKQHFDYCKVFLIDLIGIRIMEKILGVE